MREEEIDGGVHQKVVEISQLPSTAAVAGDYGNVRYLAQQLLGVMVSEVMAWGRSNGFEPFQEDPRILSARGCASVCTSDQCLHDESIINAVKPCTEANNQTMKVLECGQRTIIIYNPYNRTQPPCFQVCTSLQKHRWFGICFFSILLEMINPH